MAETSEIVQITSVDQKSIVDALVSFLANTGPESVVLSVSDETIGAIVDAIGPQGGDAARTTAVVHVYDAKGDPLFFFHHADLGNGGFIDIDLGLTTNPTPWVSGVNSGTHGPSSEGQAYSLTLTDQLGREVVIDLDMTNLVGSHDAGGHPLLA